MNPAVAGVKPWGIVDALIVGFSVGKKQAVNSDEECRKACEEYVVVDKLWSRRKSTNRKGCTMERGGKKKNS